MDNNLNKLIQSSNPEYWDSKANVVYSDILIETLKTILKDKDIISGDMEFDQYLEKVLSDDDHKYITGLNRCIFMRNYCEIINRQESLSKEEEDYIREHAIDYFDDINTQEDLDNLIKTLSNKKSIYSLLKFKNDKKDK